MSELIDRLGDLTGFRDRDVLDVTLATSLRDLLRPNSVTIYRCVGDEVDLRWLTRARLVGNEVAAAADSVWVDIRSLPPLQRAPLRARCLLEQELIEDVAGPMRRTSFPLAGDRGPLGVIEIERAESLSETEKRLVAGFARIYRNMVSLLDYSERDTLTGLLTRKTFDDSFMKCAAGRPDAREGEGDVDATDWLGVVDIDHFKQVNDRFGHLIGDEVLLLMARLLQSTFRLQDRLYRFGGEEFVVLVRCRGEHDARAAFERVRANVEAYAFPQVGRITISVGFTGVRPGDSPASAFARADQAVYQAKADGRNRVVSHAALVAQGLADDGAQAGGIELF
jgi:diguanylate cyclase (GGDEF)-like protein